MSDAIKKQDIEKVKKVISETHNRWDRNEYRGKEKRIYSMDTRYIQEKIQEIIQERPDIPLDELFVSCWKKYLGQCEKEETLGLDLTLAADNIVALIISIITYYFMKKKSMSPKKGIELIYSYEKKSKDEKKTYFKISL